MARTLINLDPEDKEWLDREARARHVPMTELVRQAVRDYRTRQQSLAHPSLQTALARTAGLWRAGDGLVYQRRLREEWEPPA
ncbi:MAG: ribbon-helix-helix domain-containing protein [Porticoccaceae bacterium]